MSEEGVVIGVHSEIEPQLQALVTYQLALTLERDYGIRILVFDLCPGKFIEKAVNTEPPGENLKTVTISNLTAEFYSRSLAKELCLATIDSESLSKVQKIPLMLEKAIAAFTPKLVIINFMPGFHPSQCFVLPLASEFLFIGQSLPPFASLPLEFAPNYSLNLSKILNPGYLTALNQLLEPESGIQFRVRDWVDPIAVINFLIWTSELPEDSETQLHVTLDKMGFHGFATCGEFRDCILRKLNLI